MNETKNAIIKSTHLGVEDHGIMTAYLHLDYGGSSQSFGGWALDEPLHDKEKKFLGRRGTGVGMEFVMCILDTLKVGSWEKLPGTHCRVVADYGKVSKIGHIIEDQWFEPAELMRKAQP